MSGNHNCGLYLGATEQFDFKSEELTLLNNFRSDRYLCDRPKTSKEYWDITDRQQRRPSKPSYLKSSNDLCSNEEKDNLDTSFPHELYSNDPLNRRPIKKSTAISENMGRSTTKSSPHLDVRLEYIERKLNHLYGDDIRTKFRKMETTVSDNMKKLEAQIKELQDQYRELKHSNERERWQGKWVTIGERATDDKKAFGEIVEWKERLEERENLLASERKAKEKLFVDLKKQETEKLEALEKLKVQEMQIRQLTDNLRKGEAETKQIENLKRNLREAQTALTRIKEEKETRETCLQNQNASLRNELKMSSAKILEQGNIIHKNDSEIEILTMKLRDETEKVLINRSSQEKLNAKSTEITKLQIKISSMETRYEEALEKISCLESQLSKAEANLYEKNRSYDLLVTPSQGKEEVVKKDLEDRLIHMETKYEQSVVKITTLECQLSTAAASLREKDKSYDLLFKISKEKEQAAKEEFENAVAETRKVKLELSTTQAELSKKVNEVHEMTENYFAMENKYDGIVEELQRMRNELSSAEANVQGAYDSYELLQKRSKEKEMAVNEEYDMTVNELNDIKKELSAVKSQLTMTARELEDKKSEHLLTEKETEAKNDEIITLKRKNSCLEKELTSSETQVKTLSQSLMEKTSSLENSTEKAGRDQRHLQEIIAEQENIIFNHEVRTALFQNKVKKLKASNEDLEVNLSLLEDNANILKTAEINLKMDMKKLMNDKKALNERCSQLEELLEKKGADDNR